MSKFLHEQDWANLLHPNMSVGDMWKTFTSLIEIAKLSFVPIKNMNLDKGYATPKISNVL